MNRILTIEIYQNVTKDVKSEKWPTFDYKFEIFYIWMRPVVKIDKTFTKDWQAKVWYLRAVPFDGRWKWQDAIKFRISWPYLCLVDFFTVDLEGLSMYLGTSLLSLCTYPAFGGLASVSGLARESWGPWRGYRLSWYHLGTWCRMKDRQRFNMAPL